MSTISSSERFTLVDALRGMASLSVFFCHFMLLVAALTESHFHHAWIVAASDYFAVGVQIFFVLSGFVIAHSLRHNPLTWTSVGRFMLRRQLRLDPVYWFMLLIMLCLGVLSRQPRPGTLQVFLNFTYLQNVFHAQSLLDVSWTLCLEVQFYVFFLACLLMGKMLSEKVFTGKRVAGEIGLPTLWIVFATGVISLVVAQVPRGFLQFPRFWFYFVAGVFSYWTFRKVIAKGWFIGFQMLFAGAIVWASLAHITYPDTAYAAQRTTPSVLLVGFLTSLILWYAGRRRQLTQWGQNVFLQYFGRISYSLYLIHLPMLLGFGLLGEHFLKTPFGVSWRYSALAMLLLASIAYSIAAANLLYNRVERPSIRFAARFKDEAISAANIPRADAAKM